MYAKVSVITGARKEIFSVEKEGYFKISVKEKRERNMANERILELVALYYKVPKNKVKIINGHHHSSKLLSINIE